jgi:predicted small secreted protein
LGRWYRGNLLRKNGFPLIETERFQGYVSTGKRSFLLKKENFMKKRLIALFLLGIALLASGCNTVHGAGEDVEAVGRGVARAV